MLLSENRPTMMAGESFVDSDFDICFAAARSLTNVSNAFQVETMALSNAIDIADNLGVGKVAFETNRINLKNTMSLSEYDLGPMVFSSVI
jgi:hypothetical protein